jgi:4a-hydroxytetrahydrobiopterin dehydratase
MDKDNVECWTTKDHPPGLFRRFEFENYSKLRTFLDRLADLSKEKEYYPDISFGVTYANITVYASDAAALSDEDKAFSHSVDELI